MNRRRRRRRNASKFSWVFRNRRRVDAHHYTRRTQRASQRASGGARLLCATQPQADV